MSFNNSRLMSSLAPSNEYWSLLKSRDELSSSFNSSANKPKSISLLPFELFSILRRDLILLQLSVRHLVRPRAYRSLRKTHDVYPERHAATQALRSLHE